jgi:hypothetical protein
MNKTTQELSVVGHACNPGYAGDGGGFSLRPAQAKGCKVHLNY